MSDDTPEHESSRSRSRDPYIEYTHRFFLKWLPVYDLFGSTILPIYRAAARRVEARPGLRVLDVCTGTGEMALRAAREGATVTGIDITLPMMEKARRKAGDLEVSFQHMDARKLDFKDKSFDVSILSLALHDMPRRVRIEVLRELRRVTRDRIVILDYDFPANPFLRRTLTWLVQLFETVYLSPFATEGVTPLLEEVGLEIVEKRLFRPLVFGLYVVKP